VPLKILSWNIHCVRGVGKRVLRIAAAIGSEDPDVVLLQEVAARWDVPDSLRRALAEQGLPFFRYSGDEPPPEAIRQRHREPLARRRQAPVLSIENLRDDRGLRVRRRYRLTRGVFPNAGRPVHARLVAVAQR